MSYQETLDYLYTATPAFHMLGAKAYKPGPENTLRLMQAVGNPHIGLRAIHIAGTNGKGSTSHMIAAALLASGYRVGLYTSPHLVDYRERIRVLQPDQPEADSMVSEQYVIRWVEQYQAVLEELKPSFFEMATAMAFCYYREQNVDIAVIEVGLGGRLDSTNIITPLLSVITNIGMDHTEFLGNSLAAIAQEKAGIIKPKIPVVIGETHPETAPVFLAQAAAQDAPIHFADQCSPHPIRDCELHGLYQSHNIQTAYTALQLLGISQEAIQTGMSHVVRYTGLQGRWQQLQTQPLLLCDTGHNSHGIRYVAEQLQALLHDKPTAQLHIVFGMVNDKDVNVVLQLLPRNAHYYFTQAHTHRAIPCQTLLTMAADYGLTGQSYDTTPAALQAAQANARIDDIIFVGGSNYIVGEVLAQLKS